MIYDADSAQFLFGEWAFSKPDTLGKNWERRYGIDIGHLNEIAVRISEKEIVKGSYIGSNAFGVSAKVQEIEKHEIGIFERSGSFSDDEDLFGYGNGQKNILPDDVLSKGKGGRPVIRISAPIEAAKLMKGTLAAAVLVKPKEPYYVRGTQHISPTLEGKRDITLVSEILVADIKCVFIYDKQQTVIESAATQ